MQMPGRRGVARQPLCHNSLWRVKQAGRQAQAGKVHRPCPRSRADRYFCGSLLLDTSLPTILYRQVCAAALSFVSGRRLSVAIVPLGTLYHGKLPSFSPEPIFSLPSVNQHRLHPPPKYTLYRPGSPSSPNSLARPYCTVPSSTPSSPPTLTRQIQPSTSHSHG